MYVVVHLVSTQNQKLVIASHVELMFIFLIRTISFNSIYLFYFIHQI